MGAVSDAAPRGEGMQARLEEAFMAEREQEWGSFLAKSGKFGAGIDQEIRIEKFTAAGPGEEEHNLERLRRWFRDLHRRDVLVAPSRQEAERKLKECD